MRISSGKGRRHDVAVLTQCRLRIGKELKTYADSGYHGILTVYPNSLTPITKPRHRELTKKECVCKNCVLDFFGLVCIVYLSR